MSHWFYNFISVGGGVAGTVFRLSIVPTTPMSQAVTLTNRTISLTWSTEAGGRYQLQYNSGLSSSNWINLGNAATAAGAALRATDSVTNAPRRFYRVVLSLLDRCTLRCNSAFSSEFSLIDAYGGGAYACVLNNCVLAGNSVDTYGHGEGLGSASGGGASSSTLSNCTLIDNSAVNWEFSEWFGEWYPDPYASNGGGGDGGVLKKCIVYFNTASNWPNDYDTSSTLNYCCTTPMPTNGFGNITNSPLFVDLAGGDLRLQSNSPCINAGNNSYVTTPNDLDGRPRIVGRTVDIGAYGYQTPTSIISYAWLQQHGLPTDGSADFTDPDGDGMNNWQEWRCGSDPTNPLSALRMVSAFPNGTNVTVTWQSVVGLNYFIERCTNMAIPGVFATVATNVLGRTGETTYTDINAVGPGPFFYRVRVGN